jgi:hypothetical protein
VLNIVQRIATEIVTGTGICFFLLLPSTNIIHYYIVGLRLLDPNWLENGKPPVTCKYLPSPAFWTQRPVGFGDQL